MVDTQYIKDMFIIGAGGLGRELYGWVKNSNSNFEVKGFIDDNPNALQGTNCDLGNNIFGNLSIETLSKAKKVFLAITDPELKHQIFNWEQETKAFEIHDFIFPNAIFGNKVVLGQGTILSPNTLISSNSTVGKGAFINCGSQIGHDVKIGNYANIMASVNIGGEARIGDNVFIGTGAIILPRISIANNVRIGAGAVIMRNIKTAGTYIGNPAKRIF